MESVAYDKIAALESGNWWYIARRDLLDRTLRRLAALRGGERFAVGLDLGCGVGSNLQVLARHCDEAIGIDFSEDAVRWCRENQRGIVEQGDIGALEREAGSVDLVVCTDVLEHVDDARALAEIRRVLRPGGLALLTVPAHAYLWNENDDLSHHLRRYDRKSFRALLAGWRVHELSWWNATMYLPALAYCTMRKLTGPGEAKNNLERVPGLANRPLVWLLGVENRMRRLVPAPTGTSLFAVVENATPAEGGGGA